MKSILEKITILTENNLPLKDKDIALSILNENEIELNSLLALTKVVRFKNFGNKIRIHIINNIRNGHCPEDCSYCAQRTPKKNNKINNLKEFDQINSKKNLIPNNNLDTTTRINIESYPEKSDKEILDEARSAWQNGAYRYCMVSAGRGPSKYNIERYAKLITEIKTNFPNLQVCLSAGLIKDKEFAVKLSEAGLDRYNHNLNSTEENYSTFCTTHSFNDRLQTLKYMQDAGVNLCSGFIVGLGENKKDIVDLAFKIKELGVVSVPVNFFLPVNGHEIKMQEKLTSDYCIRILCLLRLTNPTAELRAAAGREYYLKDKQKEALTIINSLFVSGYLNVKGESIIETYKMIIEAGYEIESNVDLKKIIESNSSDNDENFTQSIYLKNKKELRPFLNIKN